MEKTIAGIRFLCLVGLHPWGKWENADSIESEIGKLKQKRECPDCGRVEVRLVYGK